MNASQRFTNSVSAADISRNFGEWQSRALSAPLTITHHGRARLVLMSIEEFDRLGHMPESRCAAGAWQGDARLHAVANQMRDGFLSFSENLTITDANVAAELHLGVDRDRMVGRDLRDVVPGSRTSILFEHLNWVQRTRQPSEHQLRSMAHEGWRMSFRLFPYDESGVAMIFNSLKPAEEAGRLMRRFQALEALVRAGPDTALIRLNARGEIGAIDSAFLQITGFAEPQLLGLLLIDIIEPGSRGIFSRALNRTLKTGDPQQLVIVILGRDGEPRRLGMCLSCADAETAPDEVFVAIADLKRMADALRAPR